MANNITRWNPLREMAAMQSAMDRLFEETWRPLLDNRSTGINSLALDVDENDNAYTVTTEMPGVKPENIHVKLDGDYLMIEGEIPAQETTEEGTRSLMRERRYGRFTRSIRLPLAVESDKVEATYEDGVLKLTLPKSEVAQPKQIPVKAGNNAKNN